MDEEENGVEEDVTEPPPSKKKRKKPKAAEPAEVEAAEPEPDPLQGLTPDPVTVTMAHRVDAWESASSLMSKRRWPDGEQPTFQDVLVLASWLLYGDSSPTTIEGDI